MHASDHGLIVIEITRSLSQRKFFEEWIKEEQRTNNILIALHKFHFRLQKNLFV